MGNCRQSTYRQASKNNIDNSRLLNNTKMLQKMQLHGEGVKIDLMNLDNVILQY